jgi:hypothetical protein
LSERAALPDVSTDVPFTKDSMSDRQVILAARGSSVYLELVLERETLYVTRNGDHVPEARWHEKDVNAASEAFYRLMKTEGLR